MKVKKRTILLKIIFALFLFALVGHYTYGAEDSVRVYFKPLISFAPLMIAEEEGFFEDEGVTVEFVQMRNTSDALLAVLQGKLDVAYGPPTGGLYNAAHADKILSIVATYSYLDVKNDYSGIVVNTGMTDDTDVATLLGSLKGNALAFPILGSMPHYFIEKLMKRYGLVEGDIEFAIMPFSSIPSAISGNVVEAGFLVEPFVTLLNRKHEQVPYISIGKEFPDTPLGYMMYGETLLHNKPDVGLKFMKAYLRGCAQYNELKSNKNISILKKYLKIDETTMREMKWTTIRPGGIYETAILESFQDWLIQKHYVGDAIDVASMVDTTYYEKAREALSLREGEVNEN